MPTMPARNAALLTVSLAAWLTAANAVAVIAADLAHPIVDSDQAICYDCETGAATRAA